MTNNYISQENANKRENLKFMNHETVISGKLQAFEDDDGSIVYQLFDAMIWDTSKQAWFAISNDPDKFQIRAENFATAQHEFWTRWKHYIKQRFQRNYIKLELTHI